MSVHQCASHYADELGRMGHGCPLWFPEPLEQGGPVEIGDVGVLVQGQFHRFFNPTKPANDKLNEKLAHYNEALERLSIERHWLQAVQPHYLPKGPIQSTHIRQIQTSADANVLVISSPF